MLMSYCVSNPYYCSKSPIRKAHPGQLIIANSDKLQQVFLNLLLNAIDAVGNNGKIKVTTSIKDSQVNVVISDSGSGISNELRSEIFTAFFTTKGDKGSGLGLYITKGIIEAHGGKIWVESKGKDKGTEVNFTLPI